MMGSCNYLSLVTGNPRGTILTDIKLQKLETLKRFQFKSCQLCEKEKKMQNRHEVTRSVRELRKLRDYKQLEV